MSEENRALSDIVWTPERGLSEPEIRGISWNNFLLSDESYGGRWRTESEVRVTPDTALQSTVVLACCRILAETISSLPLHVYRRVGDGSKEVARDIPLYRVLSFAPNSWQTKFEFFEQMVMNICLWGNSYTQIKSGRYGAVSELINLHPSRMDVERLENGRLRYQYTNPETGRLEPYTQDQIMHVRWTAEPDGIKGMVPVEVARESIALARACEIHAAKFWANSARPGMVLQTDGSLSPEAAERLRDNWERLHRGVDRAYKTAILTNGLKVEPVGFTAEQSQFESTRRFQSEEIARVYRLPLRLVQGQSAGNPEVEGQDFVTYTLVPWLRRIESAISRSLIYNDDLFVAEFDVRGLMRGDSNSRAGYYSTMTNLGIFSINDCRRLENMAPLENGDKHFVGMNMQTLEDAVKPKPDPMAAPPGAAPPPAQGGVPSLPEVKTGKAPNEAEKGEKSEPKPPQEKRALSPQNQALYDAQEEIVKASGRWPQQGAAGAHYMDKNPFASRGIACRNCVYFEEDGSCEIVKGAISPNAICKLWIIPEEKLQMPESRAFCPTGDGGGIKNDCGSGGEKADRIAEKARTSIDLTNGFSIHPVTEDTPAVGYMVGVVKAAEVVIDSKEEVTGELISKFMEDNKSQFEARPALHVGGWIDGESGKIFLDLSEQFDSIDDAIDAAESTDQLAIWDLNEKKEIRKEEYDARRTKPKQQARSLRLPSGGVSGEDRASAERGSEEGDGGVRCQAAAEALVRELRDAGDADVPNVVYRPKAESRAVAEYDHESDTLYVSEGLTEEVAESYRQAAARGWVSQPNPLLHELAHRHHALADAESYEGSGRDAFDDVETRSIAESVSQFAATNAREFVAEVIAGTWAGKEYSSDVMRLLSTVTNGKFSL